tara:strand:+ start:52 stop:321 length:270 start_codon:yes stop_codon:yes gene_type:complete
MKEFKIEDEGHTVGCILRPRLFEAGADFAACIVNHPEDKHMTIKVSGENIDEYINETISNSINDLNEMIKTVSAYIAHENAMNTDMDIS